jgi:hypothetical protein
LYIILPYFTREIVSPENNREKILVSRPTQTVVWAQEMMKGFEYLKQPITITKGVKDNDWM